MFDSGLNSPEPLGPIGRLICGTIALGTLIWIAIASGLQPDPRGHSTHTQLGLSRCHWRANHGGEPCPTCGMTTAFSQAAQGQWGSAISIQPAGALIALMVSIAFWISLWGAATGSKAVLLSRHFIGPMPLLGIAMVIALSWVYTLGR